MKINWGTGVVIAFALFIGFIMYFIIKVQTNPSLENQLVVEEYYKHDADYSKEMTREQNAQKLKEKPHIINDKNGITIVFPAAFVANEIKGTVSFYRPSNNSFDCTLPLQLDRASFHVPKGKLLEGRWNIVMEWHYHGIAYLSKEFIYVP